MEFTGERYIPSQQGKIKYEHLHRYGMLRSLVQGKTVLDIACGEGYGSALLAIHAKSVLGIDISAATIAHAQQTYRDRPNIHFLVGDCAAIPIASESKEMVVSFETLEHTAEQDEMLREIKRILIPAGVFVVSTPNRFIYSGRSNYVNPFHVKELDYAELASLLKKQFRFVQFFGQKIAAASFVFPLEDAQRTNLTTYVSRNSQIQANSYCLDTPAYFVALCSDAEEVVRQPLDSVYIDPSDDLFTPFYSQIQSLQTELAQSQQELSRTKLKLKTMQQSKFWKLRNQYTKLKMLFR
ncbi:MAG TPA: class I SAM-dependent methyltransferase [Anaerolineae bacterium]|nr:class I SAM-dependent methyltransferase [Anaerolineae bacterium]